MNRKGFTLVELLAVIVILALIMSIAIVGIGEILESARESTFKETAATIIHGVKQRLTLANRLESGDYEILGNILDKSEPESPLGGTIHFRSSLEGCSDVIGDAICKVNYKACSSSATSFVRVSKASDNNYSYSICLTAGEDNRYIDLVSEEELLDTGNSDMIKDSSSDPTYFSPNTPTIKGGATKVYNYSSTTLTCETTTQYETGTSIYYEFGYATSAANWTAGTITWLGNPSTTATLSVAKNAYTPATGTRYYGCRIYVSNGGSQSEAIVSTGTTGMAFVNARLYFNATTNGGTIDGSVNLYSRYGVTTLYTSRTNSTAGTIPIATKSGKTFTGWWTAASGGTKVIDANRNVIASVSSWTNASKQWLRTNTKNNDTVNVLYAQFS